MRERGGKEKKSEKGEKKREQKREKKDVPKMLLAEVLKISKSGCCGSIIAHHNIRGSCRIITFEREVHQMKSYKLYLTHYVKLNASSPK